MPDPITDLTGTDNGTQLKDKVNQNFAQRGWWDVTEIAFADTPYTVVDGDELIRVDPTGGAVVVNLPAVADSANRTLLVEAANVANTITLDGNASEQINGAATKTIGTAGRLVTLWCDGVKWTAWTMDRLA